MATHSSILAWRIPWTEEPGRLQSIMLQRVRYDWSNLAHMHKERSDHCHDSWEITLNTLEFPDRNVFVIHRGGGALVSKSCPTLTIPWTVACPGCSVHRILQARILEWVAISFSRGSSLPRNQTGVSCIAGRFFTSWAMREPHGFSSIPQIGEYNLLKISHIFWHLGC